MRLKTLALVALCAAMATGCVQNYAEREVAQGAAAGVLVALREVVLAVDRIDDLPGRLEGEAQLVAASAASQQYAFRLLHGGLVLASGRAAAMLRL